MLSTPNDLETSLLEKKEGGPKQLAVGEII